MSALPLKMLAVRPICIPEYRDERIHMGYGQWYLDNHNLLADFYNALAAYTDSELDPLADFYIWTRDQYQRELARVMCLESLERLPHGSSL